MNVFIVQDAVDDAQTNLRGVVELLDCAAGAPDELGAAGLEIIADRARLALDDLNRARAVLVDADDEDGADGRFFHITPEEKQIAMREGYEAGLAAGRVEYELRQKVVSALASAGRVDEIAETVLDNGRLNELESEFGLD